MAEKEKKIKCPSCQNVHDLNDYPGAFEIPCSCGYSILVPDVDAFLEKDEGEETRYESRVPTAMDAEDEAVKVPVEVPGAQDLSFEVSPTAPDEVMEGVQSMTPPEKLPEEMAYDPFEIAQLETEQEGLSAEPMEELSVEPDNVQQSVVTVQNSSEADVVIQKNMLGQFGQLAGPDYSMMIKGLNREQRIELMHSVEELTRGRPWLDEELRKRKFRMESLVEQENIDAIPEILAVEIFLSVLELGGDAEIHYLGH